MGIALSGAANCITAQFVIKIVNRSGFLKKELWSDGDSVTADKGFTVHDELALVGVSLNIPVLLDGRDYPTKAEVKANQTIAPVRIHLKRQFRESKLTVSFEMKYH